MPTADVPALRPAPAFFAPGPRYSLEAWVPLDICLAGARWRVQKKTTRGPVTVAMGHSATYEAARQAGAMYVMRRGK